MKTLFLLTASSFLGLSALASAEGSSCQKGHCDTTVAKKESCDKGHCDKTVVAKDEHCEAGHCDKTVATKENCEKGHCDKTVATKGNCEKGHCDLAASKAHFTVTGMSCGTCSNKITKKLSALEGVSVQKVCHKSGHTVVKFDPAKTSKEQIQQTITTSGFKVASETISLPVKDMTCAGCSKTVSKALASVEGCTVGSVCHKSGHATVTIDPAKTSEAKVIEAINTTKFKVATPAKK